MGQEIFHCCEDTSSLPNMARLHVALTVMTIELASIAQHHMEYHVQLRGQGGGDPWVQAAKRVAGNIAVIDSLFKHYVALVDLATNYNTQERSNSWRKDQGYIGAQVCESFCGTASSMQVPCSTFSHC